MCPAGHKDEDNSLKTLKDKNTEIISQKRSFLISKEIGLKQYIYVMYTHVTGKNLFICPL